MKYSRYKRRPSFRKKRSFKRKISRLVKTVYKHPNNYKYKVLDSTNIASSVTTSNPLTYNLNSLTEGNDESGQRSGDIVKFQWIDLLVQIARNSATASPNCNVRVMVVKEYTALGSNISYSQLFNTATPQPYACRNTITRNHHRFKVYFDKIIQLGANVNSTATTTVYNNGAPSNKILRFRRKLAFTTDYSRGTAGNITDIDTNSLQLLVFTDSTLATDIVVNLSYILQYLDS